MYLLMWVSSRRWFIWYKRTKPPVRVTVISLCLCTVHIHLIAQAFEYFFNILTNSDCLTVLITVHRMSKRRSLDMYSVQIFSSQKYVYFHWANTWTPWKKVTDFQSLVRHSWLSTTFHYFTTHIFPLTPHHCLWMLRCTLSLHMANLLWEVMFAPHILCTWNMSKLQQQWLKHRSKVVTGKEALLDMFGNGNILLRFLIPGIASHYTGFN